MTNEEQLESLEHEWISLMNQVNEVERKIVQLRGIISKEAAQQKRVPDVWDSPRQQSFSTSEANPLAKGKASPAPRR